MLHNARSRYIFFGLTMLFSLFFVFWQTGVGQLGNNVFVVVNYLIFIVLFVLMLLFMLSMLKQRKSILMQITELTMQNEQAQDEITMLRKELAIHQKSVQHSVENSNMAHLLMDAIRLQNEDIVSGHSLCSSILNALSSHFELCCGLIYYKEKHSEEFCVQDRYAIAEEVLIDNVVVGEGLSGQVGRDGQAVEFCNVPVSYMKACSGLGESQCVFLYILPLIADSSVVGIVEIGSFHKLPIMAVWNELKGELSPMLL